MAPTSSGGKAAKHASRKDEGMSAAELKFTVDSAFERRAALTVDEIEGSTRQVVNRVIDGLESGEFRVAEPDGKGGWQVNEWFEEGGAAVFPRQRDGAGGGRSGAVLGQGGSALRRFR